MYRVLLLPMLALSACASGESCSDRLAGSRVQGDVAGVTVLRTGSVADALPLAIGHCAHFHRSAQYVSRTDSGGGYRFRCVMP